MWEMLNIFQFGVFAVPACNMKVYKLSQKERNINRSRVRRTVGAQLKGGRKIHDTWKQGADKNIFIRDRECLMNLKMFKRH